MEKELKNQLNNLEASLTAQGKNEGLGGLRVRTVKPQLPQGMSDKELTDRQIKAFSKESLLKPVMATPEPSKLPVPLHSSSFPLEEMKEPHNKPIRVNLTQTPASQVSSSTLHSDTLESQHKSLANQRQLSTSQISFERPQSAATQALLFNPNDIVEENTQVGLVVKQIITLLQRCLKSKNQSIFNAALDSVNDTSDNYGPALNKHLKIIVPLIEKRNDRHSS